MTLKELEQRASKEKGVVANTVKDIVEELIADGLVWCVARGGDAVCALTCISQDKIGTSNYYWSFPSQGLIVRRKRIDTLQDSIKDKKRKRDELEETQNKLDGERTDDNGREDKLQKLAQLKADEAAADAELALMRANDPELLQALRDDVKEATTASERWGDNISMVRDWCANNMGMDQEQFNGRYETGNIE